MDKTDLELRAKIATDLFDKGAARVRITDTEFDVDWKEYSAITKDSEEQKPQQTVNVNVSASASAQADLVASVSAVIKDIETQLPDYDIDPKAIPEAKAKLKTLEEELKKKSPKWDIVKDVLLWALNYSKDLSLRLIVMLVEQYTRGRSFS